MYVAPDIPDDIAGVIAPDQDPTRATIEALALEGYRCEGLSEYAEEHEFPLVRFATEQRSLIGLPESTAWRTTWNWEHFRSA